MRVNCRVVCVRANPAVAGASWQGEGPVRVSVAVQPDEAGVRRHTEGQRSHIPRAGEGSKGAASHRQGCARQATAARSFAHEQLQGPLLSPGVARAQAGC